jgi:hypothetical protein
MGTDSWSSTAGAYPAGGAGSQGDISSAGTITSSQGSPSVQGQIIQHDDKSLPVFTYNPPIPLSSGNALSGSQNWSPSPAGTTLNLRYPSVSMGNNQTITISGSGTVNLYVDGPLNVNSIAYAAGSTANLVIYQNDYSLGGASSFKFNGNATMGDPAHPNRLLLISNYTGSMGLNGGANFYGVIFAPFADIAMNGNFGMFGAVVADGFSGKINGNFHEHYDTTLGSMNLPLDPRLTATSWWPHLLIVGQP